MRGKKGIWICLTRLSLSNTTFLFLFLNFEDEKLLPLILVNIHSLAFFLEHYVLGINCFQGKTQDFCSCIYLACLCFTTEFHE